MPKIADSIRFQEGGHKESIEATAHDEFLLLKCSDDDWSQPQSYSLTKQEARDLAEYLIKWSDDGESSIITRDGTM